MLYSNVLSPDAKTIIAPLVTAQVGWVTVGASTVGGVQGCENAGLEKRVIKMKLIAFKKLVVGFNEKAGKLFFINRNLVA